MPPSVPQVPLGIPSAIAGDPEAQRFLALRRLVEAGLAAADDAESRRTANLGALLPYSAPPPAAGLARPAPVQNIADQIARLSVRPAAIASETEAERGFLMESLLPLEPNARAPQARIAPDALKAGHDRVDTLARLGLVNADERMRELAAIGQGEQALANAPPPPPPPPPPKKKRPKKKPVEGGLKPGDVPGGVIPPSGKGPVGLHLLSMASDSMTAKAVDALKKEYPELAPLEFKAVKTDIPDLGTTYRLLAGPVPANEAGPLCVALRAKGQSCAVASY
ncbi:MAG: SPOR domain-containing protein [Magnetospirillum sp.]|nr:MAG: SPOR domain-containing protein [Magnetospirillum sp.]